jgi:hypothetical protein
MGPRQFRVSGATPLLRFQFVYPHQILWRSTTEILEKRVHPIKETLRKRWDEADTSLMWIFIRCPLHVHDKASFRVYQQRRLRHALSYALKLRGLNKAGQRLSNGSPGEGSLMEPLRGSLEVVAASEIGNASIDDLVRDCDSILVKISQKRVAQES